jgi:cytochrome b subunit of formate dehydrogenase
MVHTAASAAFFVGLVAMGLVWAEDCRFGRNDLRSAGRFDLAQKCYFWLALGLGLALLGSTMLAMVNIFGQVGQAWMVEIHRWSALGLVMATVAHAYRQTIAKPGTWRALVDGRVSPGWAKHYHPLWGKG